MVTLSCGCVYVWQDHPYWFFVWLTIFTAFFVLYLRVMFTATLFHESIPVDHVLAKGILSSGNNLLRYKSR
jgi:hypothetical protein